MPKFILLASFMLITCFGRTQLEQAKRITRSLCSDTFSGRGYVHRGDSLAARFIEKEYEKIGLIPVKGHSYFQSFENPVQTFPNEMTLVIGDTLKPAIDFMVDPNSGPSKINWKYKLLTTDDLFAYDILNRFNSSVLKDKIAINSVVVDIRSIKGDSLKRINLEVIPGLAQQLHVLVLTDQKFTFSVGNEPLPFSLLYVKSNKFSEKLSIYSFIETKYFPHYLSSNVIGTIPSNVATKKKSDPVPSIFITAHYDHLGCMGKNTFFPGANDNASGVAMMLELARHFKNNPLPYNLVFVAFAGEESGLVGSSYYVQYPWIPLENIRFLINLDILGSGEEGITLVNATKHTDEFEKLKQINETFSYLPAIKSRGEAANSDHYWFSQRNVPSFFIYSLGPNKNYHDIYDTHENLSFSKFTAIFELLTKFINDIH